jgi:hypothetical protein
MTSESSLCRLLSRLSETRFTGLYENTVLNLHRQRSFLHDQPLYTFLTSQEATDREVHIE